MTLPATIIDEMANAAAMCPLEFGEGWKPLSPYAITGRGNPMLAAQWERMCYNPTQCGIIPIKNTNHVENSTDWLDSYNLAYQYKDAPAGGADATTLPGFALYAVPVNGAKWKTGAWNFTSVIASTMHDDGWVATALPWVTSDGADGKIYTSMIWDVNGDICSGFYNCEDQATDCPNVYPSNYDCTTNSTCFAS